MVSAWARAGSGENARISSVATAVRRFTVLRFTAGPGMRRGASGRPEAGRLPKNRKPKNVFVIVAHPARDSSSNTVLFNSLQFAIFFPVVTLLYFALPHR